jgi:hypothetical protein
MERRRRMSSTDGEATASEAEGRWTGEGEGDQSGYVSPNNWGRKWKPDVTVRAVGSGNPAASIQGRCVCGHCGRMEAE